MTWLIVVAGLLTLVLALPFWAPVVGLGPPSLPPAGRLLPFDDGLRVNLYDEGRGRPLIFVHGMPGSAHDWASVPQRLVQRGYRTIRYDRIGYGHSDRRSLAAHHTYQANARELLELIERLRLERPILIGWSYGGGVVMRCAQMAPDRVAGLVLIGSTGGHRPKTTAKDNLHARRRGILERLSSCAVVVRWVLGSRITALPALERMLAPSFSGEVPAGAAERAYSAYAAPGVMDTYRHEGTYSRTDELALETIAVPVVILHGTDDRVIPYATAEDLQRRMTGSRLVPLVGGSHVFPITDPNWVVTQIVETTARW